MQIQIKNKKLSGGEELITSPDIIIKLTSDIDCELIGIVQLSNGTCKSFNFIKENNYYKGRLIIYEDEVKYLKSVYMYITMITSTKEFTNTIPLNFDINKINLTVKKSKSKEIEELRFQIAQLENLVTDVLANKTVYTTALNIAPSDIKAGMIPIAINDKGLIMFKYPFQDVIKEINGQKTLNSAILLTAKDIPVGTSSNVEATLREHTEAMKSLTAYLDTISSELKAVKAKLAEVEQKLIVHTESSLI